MTDPARHREDGVGFEHIFEKQARRNGLLPIKNELRCKMGWNGKILLLPSDLDYKLINRRGVVGYFDCKTFADASFNYSWIDKDQLDKAMLYNDWDVPAGFVVLFRATMQVVFFSGHRIAEKGPRNSFSPDDGMVLGGIFDFNLKMLL